MRKAGLVCPTFQHWDRASGELIAEFDHGVLAGETAFPYVVQCEQFKISRIALARLAEEPLATLRLGAEVTGFTQDETGVDVTVFAPAMPRNGTACRGWWVRMAGAAPCARPPGSPSRASPSPNSSWS